MDSSRGPYPGRYAHETLSSPDLYNQSTTHTMAAGHPSGFHNRAYTDEQARSNQPVYQPPAIPRLPQSSALPSDQPSRGGPLAQGTTPDSIPRSRYHSNNYSGGDYSWQSSAGPTFPPSSSYYTEQGGYSTNMASQTHYVEEPLPLSSQDQSYTPSSGYQIPSPAYPAASVQQNMPYDSRSHPPMYPPHVSQPVPSDTKHIPIPAPHAPSSNSYSQETINHRASRWTGSDMGQPVSAPASSSSSSSSHQAPIPIKPHPQHQQYHHHHHQDAYDHPRSASRVLTQGPSDPAPGSSYGQQNYLFPDDLPHNVDVRGQSPPDDYPLHHRARRSDFSEYSDQNYRNPPPEPSPPTQYRSYDEYHAPVSPYGYNHSAHSPPASYSYPQPMPPSTSGHGPSSPRKAPSDEAEMVQYGVPPVKPKRRRADAAQLRVLNEVYLRTAFPSTEERTQLGMRLNMSPRQVQIWFQNRRQNARGRANSSSQQPSAPTSPGSSSTGTPSVSLTASIQSFPMSSLTQPNHRTKREDNGDDLL